MGSCSSTLVSNTNSLAGPTDFLVLTGVVGWLCCGVGASAGAASRATASLRGGRDSDFGSGGAKACACSPAAGRLLLVGLSGLASNKRPFEVGLLLRDRAAGLPAAGAASGVAIRVGVGLALLSMLSTERRAARLEGAGGSGIGCLSGKKAKKPRSNLGGFGGGGHDSGALAQRHVNIMQETDDSASR